MISKVIFMMAIITFLYLPYRFIMGVLKPQRYKYDSRLRFIKHTFITWSVMFLTVVFLKVAFDT